MKALMFGWEFPPHILGALAQQVMALPRVWPSAVGWISPL